MMLRASVDFADAWYAFLREEHGHPSRTFSIDLDPSRFPYAFAKRANLQITAVRLVLATHAPTAMNASISLPSGAGSIPANFTTSNDIGGHMLASWTNTESPESPGTFTLSVDEQDIPPGLGLTYDSTHTRFDDSKLRELVVVVFFRDPS